MGGDSLSVVRETITADGTVLLELSNDGNIIITSITDDGTLVDSAEYSNDGGLVTFTTAPEEASEMFVIYQQSTYTDDEIIAFLEDSARIVGADLCIEWVVDTDNHLITHDDDGVVDALVEQLIIFATAMTIFNDRANAAAGEAILIKDGDTTIDTSKTSGALSKRIESFTKQYGDMLVRAQLKRFGGHVTEGGDNDHKHCGE